MYAFMRKIAAVLCVVAVLMTIGGCIGSSEGGGLLVAPRTAARYANLYEQIEKMIATGLEYSAPTGGSNRQTIQL